MFLITFCILVYPHMVILEIESYLQIQQQYVGIVGFIHSLALLLLLLMSYHQYDNYKRHSYYLLAYYSTSLLLCYFPSLPVVLLDQEGKTCNFHPRNKLGRDVQMKGIRNTSTYVFINGCVPRAYFATLYDYII